MLGGVEVPIAGIAGDQQAALFGQACFEPGMAKNTYGTGCFLLMNTGREPLVSANRLLTTIAWATDARHYALEGAVFVGGAVVQWLRDGLGFIERSERDRSARRQRCPTPAACISCLPLPGSAARIGTPMRAAPWSDSRAARRGRTSPARRSRRIAFQSAEVLHAMQKDARQPLRELRVDGGATANDLLMQFQADLLGVPVVRPAGHRDHRARRGVSRGTGHGFLGIAGGNRGQLARRAGRSSPQCPVTRPPDAWRAGPRPIDRCRDWHPRD